MMLSKWFTDPKYGCREAREAKEPEAFEHQHWAGQQIVRFFIDWKAYLATPDSA